MQYPVIQYPDSFKSLISSYPTLPKEPEKPSKPQKPNMPVSNDSLGCSGLLLIPAVIFLFYSFNQTALLIPAIVAFIFILIYTLNSSVSSDDKAKEKYENDLKAYNISLVKYKTELERYPSDYDEWYTESLIMSSSEFIEDYRLFRIREHFRVNTLPKTSESSVKAGVTEQFFLEYLNIAFGSNVLSQQEVVTVKGRYYPDFVITDHHRKVYIDVEIDEPYVGSTGEPIHYFNIDQKRNIIFSQLNWVVIRFAEEQIIRQPLECCELIKKVLSHLEVYSQIDNSQSTVQKVNIWSFKEASSMAFRRYRHSYLGISLQSKLASETFENETIVFDERIAEWQQRAPFEETKYVDEDDDLPF